MKSFVTRALSAIVAVAVVWGLWHFLNVDGLRLLVVIAVVVGGLELVRILFKSDDSRLNRSTFYVFNLALFALASLQPSLTAVAFACFSILFCLVSLVTQKKFDSLEELTHFQAKSIMGFFYVGLLPACAMKLLGLPDGPTWFVTLMAIVFCGDVGAYLAGMTMGRHKLMPMISPKKTIEGSIGGLAASTIVAVVCAGFLNQPPAALAVLGLCAGIVGQFGDLFESQLKRVADVKDSGRIMPGHGGILDRIDGALFAAPVILLGASFLS